MSHRLNALAEQIRQMISFAVSFEMRDPKLEGITITRVKLSPDFQFADVLFTLLDEDEKRRITAERALTGAAGAFKKKLAKNLDIRRIPNLRFHFDQDVADERRIGEVLDTLNITDKDDEA